MYQDATAYFKRWRGSLLSNAIALLVFGRPVPAWPSSTCTDKCGFRCDAIANGPFAYTDASGATSATFIGETGDPVSLSFTVTAPNAAGDVVVFPGEGQNACSGTAEASVGVLEITQIADANGNQL